MDNRQVKKLKVGYFSYSEDLSHPSDRRRLVFWARHREHEILVNPQELVDVIVVSERTNLTRVLKRSYGAPLIFDLIDAYLVRDSLMRDYARGVGKVLTKQVSGAPKAFTSIIQDFCNRSSAVICSSPEQEVTIKPYATNTHVILDSHNEFPLLPFHSKNRMSSERLEILWEGMPYTLGAINQVSEALEFEAHGERLLLNIVTDPNYYRFFGKFFRQSTQDLIVKKLGTKSNQAALIPWERNSLIRAAKSASAAVIPITNSNPFQWMKPENRLLIMWRLGLPCLTSATPSYLRASAAATVDTICSTPGEWSQKLSKLLSDSSSSELIVNKGQKYLNEFHNTEVLLQKWDSAIESVL